MVFLLLNASCLISSHVRRLLQDDEFFNETFVEMCTISWEISVSRNHRPNGIAVAKMVRLHHHHHSHNTAACIINMWASFYSIHRLKPIFMSLIKQNVAVFVSFSWIILWNLMSDVHSIVWDRVAMVHTQNDQTNDLFPMHNFYDSNFFFLSSFSHSNVVAREQLSYC